MYRKLLLVALAITVILLASTCSGTGTSDTTALQPAASPTGGGLEFADLDLDFPPPSELAARITSLDDDWLKPGAAYEEELPHVNVTVEDASLRYRVVSESDPGHYQQAHAFYAFDIINHPISTELKLIWHDYPGNLQCYIGLPVPETDEWDWVPMPSDCRIPLPDISKFLSAGMPLTVGVVLFGTEDQVLDWVRLGENAPPEAGLTVTPDSGECPLTATLDASSSIDPDGNLVSYDWDFDGDGTIDSRSYTRSWTKHTYSTPGSYEATVTVYDDAGDYDSAFVPVTVTANNNVPPTADLTADPLLGEPPHEVSFDASGSTDSDGEIVRYDWDFDGDGKIDYRDYESPLASYEYVNEGVFKATVYVTDNLGAQDSASVNIHVGNGLNQPPVAQLSADPQAGMPPLTVQYDASASTDSDGEIVSYEWDFDGDGEVDYNSGTDPLAEHTFETEISCDSTVTVTDDDGDSDTVSIGILAGTWVQSWGFENNDSFTSVVQDNEGNLYVCGSSIYEDARAHGILFKFRGNGTPIWGRLYDLDEKTNFCDVALDSEGNIWATGAIEQPGAQYQEEYDVLLVQFTPEGEIVSQQAWGRDYFDRIYSMVIDEDDNKYFVGTRRDSEPEQPKCLVSKIDPTGTKLWDKEYGWAGHIDHAYKVLITPENSLAISGTTGIGESTISESFIFRIDADGQIISSNRFHLQDLDTITHYMSLGPDGSYYLSGSYVPAYSDGEYLNAWILKLGTDYSPLWSMTWHAAGHNFGRNHGIHRDGNVYMSINHANDGGLRNNLLLAISPDGQYVRGMQRSFGSYHLCYKPEQPLFMLGCRTASYYSTEWAQISSNLFTIEHPDVVHSSTLPECSEITLNQWTPEGTVIDPQGVYGAPAGNHDAVITSFY